MLHIPRLARMDLAASRESLVCRCIRIKAGFVHYKNEISCHIVVVVVYHVTIVAFGHGLSKKFWSFW